MNALLQLDGQILLWIQEHVRGAALTPVMRLITSLGDVGAVWIALTLALLAIRRTRKVGVCCALGLILSLLMTNLALKNWIQRARPFEHLDTLRLLIRRPSDFSFPSGHTSASFAVGWTMFRRLPRRFGVLALVLAALIALSRLYVGAHYPTDVLGGAAVGLLSSHLARRLTDRLLPEPAR